MIYFFKENLKTSFFLWLNVVKMMVPIAICVKILETIGAIDLIGFLLEPIMISVGLPGIMGLVWAVTMFTNIWTGALLFITLLGSSDITSAQVTILGIMMLMSHALPLEIRLVQKCGVNAAFSIVLRIGSSLVLAYLFNWTFSTFELLNHSASIVIGESVFAEQTLLQWVIRQLESLVLVYFMLIGLVLILDLMKRFNLIHKLGDILSPYFTLIGVSRKCAPITFVGMTLGLVYGGSLLLQEVEKEEVNEDDIHLSVISMNLFHSIIEDTIIIFMMGGAIFWILIVRFIYTVIILKAINYILAINNGFFWKVIKK